MYAHQVIEDCLRYASGSLGEIIADINQEHYKKHCDWFAGVIDQSIKFHAGDGDSFFNQFPKYNGMAIQGIGEKCPYNAMWVDCFSDALGGRKYGATILTMDNYAMVCCAVKDKNSEAWLPTPLWHYYSLGGVSLCSNEKFKSTIKEKLDIEIEQTVEPQHTCIIKIANASEDVAENGMKLDNPMIALIYIVLGLLNCKNIGTIDNEPPAKLNKSRVKKGMQPIFTYKTLVIKPTGKRQQSLAAQGLWENRIHLCRGHFKEYTADKPLFGRFAGRYWWQPSVRGRNTQGVVMKDYEVKNGQQIEPACG